MSQKKVTFRSSNQGAHYYKEDELYYNVTYKTFLIYIWFLYLHAILMSKVIKLIVTYFL